MTHNSMILYVFVATFGLVLCNADQEQLLETAETIYEFCAENLDGEEVCLDKYKGHPLIVMNTASLCGLTAVNFKEMGELCKKYEPQGLKCLYWPSGDFANQEYPSNKQIKDITVQKYKIAQDVFSKEHVKGSDAHLVWKWLSKKCGEPKWNFSKRTIDKEGKIVECYEPTVTPKSMENDIIKLLEQ